MLDADAAREIVREALRGAEDRGGVRCVRVGETLDFNSRWVQGYQSGAFAVHGDIFEALTANGPYVIPKNGDAVLRLSNAEPEPGVRPRSR